MVGMDAPGKTSQDLSRRWDKMQPDNNLTEAAPDLLEALLGMVSFCDANDNFTDGEFKIPDFILQAHAAIAKAEGWSQCQDGQHRGRVHHDPRLRFGPPLDTCIDCMEEEAADHTNTRIQVGCGYIIVDREECQNMRHVEEGE